MNLIDILRGIWLAAIGLFIWIYGPVIAIDHWHPLASEPLRILVLAIIGTYIIAQPILFKKPTLKKDIQTFNDQLQAHLSQLYKSHWRKVESVVLIIGNEKTGKTSLIQQRFRAKTYPQTTSPNNNFEIYHNDNSMIIEINSHNKTATFVNNCYSIIENIVRKKLKKVIIMTSITDILNLSDRQPWVQSFQSKKADINIIISHSDRMMGYHEANKYIDPAVLQEQLTFVFNHTTPEQQMNELIRQFNYKSHNTMKIIMRALPLLKTQHSKHNLFEFPCQIYSIMSALKRLILFMSCSHLKHISLTHLSNHTDLQLIDNAVKRIQYALPMVKTNSQLRPAYLLNKFPDEKPHIYPSQKKWALALIITSIPLCYIGFYLHKQLDQSISNKLNNQLLSNQANRHNNLLTLINSKDIKLRSLKPLAKKIEQQLNQDMLPQLANDIIQQVFNDDISHNADLKTLLLHQQDKIKIADLLPYCFEKDITTQSLLDDYFSNHHNDSAKIIQLTIDQFNQNNMSQRIQLLFSTNPPQEVMLETIEKWHQVEKQQLNPDELESLEDMIATNLILYWDNYQPNINTPKELTTFEDILTEIDQQEQQLNLHSPYTYLESFRESKWLNDETKTDIINALESSYQQSDLHLLQDKLSNHRQILHNIASKNTNYRSFLLITKLATHEQLDFIDTSEMNLPAYKAYLEQIQDASIKLYVKHAKQYIEQLWKDIIIKHHLEKLNQYYPVNLTSDLDLSIDDFDEYFNPVSGIASIFKQRYIEPFSNFSEGIWAAKTLPNLSLKLELNPTIYNYFSKVNLIQEAFYKDKVSPSIDFGITATTSADSVDHINLISQKRNVMLYPSQRSSINAHWPTPATHDTVILQVTKKTEETLLKTTSGPWAIFKLFQFAKHQLMNYNNKQHELRILLDDQPVDLKVTSDIPVYEIAQQTLFNLKDSL